MKVILARDIMVTRVVTLRPHQDIHEAIKLLLKRRISGAPVVDNRLRLIGMLSEYDCLNVLTHSAIEGVAGGTVADYMTKKVTTVPPTADIITVASIFMKYSLRRLPVMEHERVIGQVSRRDVLRGIQAARQPARRFPDYAGPR